MVYAANLFSVQFSSYPGRGDGGGGWVQEGRRGARHGHFSNCEDPRVGMEPVVATAVHAAEPNPNVAPVIAAAAVVTAVAEVSIAAVPMVIVEGAAVPMVTAVAEASTIDDIPEATAEVVFVTSPAAADGAGEKRGRKSGTKVPRWTPEEEVRLRALVEELGEKDWTSVAGRLETGRSPAGVEQHWQIMSGKRKRNGEALTKKKTDEDGTGEAGEAGAAGAEGRERRCHGARRSLECAANFWGPGSGFSGK